MNRRHSQRIPSRLFVELDDSNINGIAYAADVSPDGCQLYLSQPVAPGTSLHGHFLVGHQAAIPFEGEVRWSRPAASTPGDDHLASLGLLFALPTR